MWVGGVDFLKTGMTLTAVVTETVGVVTTDSTISHTLAYSLVHYTHTDKQESPANAIVSTRQAPPGES